MTWKMSYRTHSQRPRTLSVAPFICGSWLKVGTHFWFCLNASATTMHYDGIGAMTVSVACPPVEGGGVGVGAIFSVSHPTLVCSPFCSLDWPMPSPCRPLLGGNWRPLHCSRQQQVWWTALATCPCLPRAVGSGVPVSAALGAHCVPRAAWASWQPDLALCPEAAQPCWRFDMIRCCWVVWWGGVGWLLRVLYVFVSVKGTVWFPWHQHKYLLHVSIHTSFSAHEHAPPGKALAQPQRQESTAHMGTADYRWFHTHGQLSHQGYLAVLKIHLINHHWGHWIRISLDPKKYPFSKQQQLFPLIVNPLEIL